MRRFGLRCVPPRKPVFTDLLKNSKVVVPETSCADLHASTADAQIISHIYTAPDSTDSDDLLLR